MSEFFAHPSAVIDEPSVIGSGTKIWQFSHVMPHARIGRNCVLGQNVFVGRGVVIGTGVKIQNNVSVYEGVELEDEVFVGPSAVFTNVNNPRANIERKSEFKKTLVRTGATIGANATILCGITLGRFCFVGAGAVVINDVPDLALVVGVPSYGYWLGLQVRDALPLPAGLPEREEGKCLACALVYEVASGSLRCLR